jgi:serine phosphatase RsbU (regulator of sigma subunit)
MTHSTDSDITFILKNIPIFQGLSDVDYGEIIPLLKQENYQPGTSIIKEGAHGDSMCVIVKGAVKVTTTDETGDEILLETLYDESFFGEFSLVDNMPRSASVTSVGETELFRLEKKDFDDLLQKNRAISAAFYKNCLEVTFSRFRHIISSFAFSQHDLRQKSTILDELNRDLSQAKKIQNYFINRDLLDHEHSFLPGVRHSYIYRPCMEIGGDFLNVTQVGPGMASIIIADIMGHGITSALGTGVLKSAYADSVTRMARKPVRLMKLLNAHFSSVISQLYATCYYALIDMKRKKIKLAKAGHPHPLFWRKSARDFIEVECRGTGLGLVKKPEFGEVEYPLGPGDKILFYTDGIIEQKNPNGVMYSESRLLNIFRDLIVRNSDGIVQHINDDLTAYAGNTPIEDDITLFLLEF